MQETQEMLVCSLGWEDALEKELATYSSIVAWKLPWAEEPGRLQSVGLRRAGLSTQACDVLSLDHLVAQPSFPDMLTPRPLVYVLPTVINWSREGKCLRGPQRPNELCVQWVIFKIKFAYGKFTFFLMCILWISIRKWIHITITSNRIQNRSITPKIPLCYHFMVKCDLYSQA